MVVRSHGSWGRAAACATGASYAEGDVLHWLDADMVPDPRRGGPPLRWHHVIDHAVVLGHKLFVDAGQLPPVPKLHELALDDRLDDLFAGRWVDEHEWVEEIWRRTDDLRDAGFRAFHVHVGSTASVGRAFYAEAGGLDTSLKLGEDIELGYRLANRGGVFVADRRATSWHLGESHLMRYEKQVQRYNAPFVAQRVPDFRKFRQARGRTYQVPFFEVVLDATSGSWEQVKHTVDGVLDAQPGDLHCVLLGPWGDLDDERRSLLLDSQLDLRLLQEEYDADPRVRLVDDLAQSAWPAQFRMHLPVGWQPGVDSIEKVAREMQRRSQGLRSILLPDGQVVRVERTAAFERARRVMAADERLDDVVDQVSVTWWSDGHRDGFRVVEADRPADNAQESDFPDGPASEVAAAQRVAGSPADEGLVEAPHRHTLARVLTALGKR